MPRLTIPALSVACLLPLSASALAQGPTQQAPVRAAAPQRAHDVVLARQLRGEERGKRRGGGVRIVGHAGDRRGGGVHIVRAVRLRESPMRLAGYVVPP